APAPAQAGAGMSGVRVIPAKRATASASRDPVTPTGVMRTDREYWIPAFAGMTAVRAWTTRPSTSCRERGQFCRIIRQPVAAPHDMQVRAQKQKVAAVDIARPVLIDVENGKGRPAHGKGTRQGRAVCLRTGQTQKRVAVADAVMQRNAVGQPDMGQPRAWPAGRLVFHEIGRRPLARFGPDDRRAFITIAKLGSDHLVALALLDIGNAREIGPRCSTLRRPVANIGLPGRAPRPPAARGMTRGFDVARADLPALDLIGCKQSR